jgi:hypothetical protein
MIGRDYSYAQPIRILCCLVKPSQQILSCLRAKKTVVQNAQLILPVLYLCYSLSMIGRDCSYAQPIGIFSCLRSKKTGLQNAQLILLLYCILLPIYDWSGL